MIKFKDHVGKTFEKENVKDLINFLEEQCKIWNKVTCKVLLMKENHGVYYSSINILRLVNEVEKIKNDYFFHDDEKINQEIEKRMEELKTIIGGATNVVQAHFVYYSDDIKKLIENDKEIRLQFID